MTWYLFWLSTITSSLFSKDAILWWREIIFWSKVNDDDWRNEERMRSRLISNELPSLTLFWMVSFITETHHLTVLQTFAVFMATARCCWYTNKVSVRVECIYAYACMHCAQLFSWIESLGLLHLTFWPSSFVKVLLLLSLTHSEFLNYGISIEYTNFDCNLKLSMLKFLLF